MVRRRTVRALVAMVVAAAGAGVLAPAGTPAGATGGEDGTDSGGGASRPGTIAVTELPAIAGRRITPFAINDRGQVAATTGVTGTMIEVLTEARLYGRGGWRQVSPPAPGAIHRARPTALNERGDVGGHLQTATSHPGAITDRGFAWLGGRLVPSDAGLPDVPVQDVNERRQVLLGDRVRHDGRVTVAPAPPDGGQAWFTDLDDAGRAASLVQTPRPGEVPDVVSEAAVWRVGGGIRTLGSLPGFESSQALAVNETGMVAGSSSSVAGGIGRHRGWVWRDGRMTDVGTLGGAHTWISVGRDGLHRGPSLRGEVVGQSTTATGELHAFHWRPGRITDLGTLGGGRSWAIAVNDRGQVIGQSQSDTDRGPRAFLWQDGRMVDLTALAGNPPTTEVFDVNDRGQVVGRTSDPSTPGVGERIVVWTVPPR